MIDILTDYLKGKVPLGAARSSRWTAVRRDHLTLDPVCAVCGGKSSLVAHHIEPFHLRPDLELDPANLVTLCESGKFGVNCHLLVGHLGNFRRINRDVLVDSDTWRNKLRKP